MIIVIRLRIYDGHLGLTEESLGENKMVPMTIE